ncbi:alpha/beta fold hydrolase [Georgenia sp. Z1491]|uniref:alpha/beta fold hydrolase n=1 Tax=Georgenia sp. Z1491 TaxID=3416707 RepID=UPI003CE9B10E
MSAHSVELHESITETQLECGGYSTRILLAGPADAEPVLLLHDGAWGGSADVSWEYVIPELARDRRVIAPDLLGFGGSDKIVFLDRSPHSFRIKHIASVLAELGVRAPVDVVGNSFGGATGLRALAGPDTFPIRSLVSIAGTGGGWRTEKSLGELGEWDGTREDLARIAALLVDTDTAHFESYLDRRLHWASQSGHARSVLAPAIKIPHHLRSKVEDSWPDQLRGITTPTLLVRCARDVLLFPEWADRVAEALVDARIVEVDHLHAPNLDRPDEVVSVVRDFWREVADGRPASSPADPARAS